MPADVGQHGALQIFVFQVDRAPRVIDAAAGQILAQRVGIVEAIGSELVEGRIGIGQSLFVSRQRERSLPDAHLRLRDA